MPRTIEKLLYKFEELSDPAKERARDWWRECENQESSFSEFIIDDAVRVGEMLGIEFRTHGVRLMSGATRQDPCIWWSGFSSQGDGACFEGVYRYAKGAAKKIREYAGMDKTLHVIADNLQAIQQRHFYRLRADMSKRDHHYSHKYTVSVDVTNSETGDNVDVEIENEVKEELRDFMEWIYGQLRAEYDHAMSDENVDENIVLNAYEFDECGRIV